MTDGPERACLAIADISGYTRYLASVELDHAQDILSDLTVTVVEALSPFQLLKLEGDAAFVYMPGESLDGSLLQDTIESAYIAFRRRLRDIQQASTCNCDACVRIPNVDLKIVIHHGTFGRQRLLGLEELVGPDVILVHRLLKNSVREDTGVAAYAFYTQAIIDAAGIAPSEQNLRQHHEETDVAGNVVGWVRDLGEAWRRLSEQPPIVIPPDRTVGSWALESSAPPQVVFEYLTSPSLRVNWDASIDSISEDSSPGGGRRGAGTVNHCMHGKDAIVEQIIDWRPPEYWLTKEAMPHVPGAPQFYKSEEITPLPGGGSRVLLTLGSIEGRSPSEDTEFFAFVEANMGVVNAAIEASLATAVHEMEERAAQHAKLPSPGRRFLTEPVTD